MGSKRTGRPAHHEVTAPGRSCYLRALEAELLLLRVELGGACSNRSARGGRRGAGAGSGQRGGGPRGEAGEALLLPHLRLAGAAPHEEPGLRLALELERAPAVALLPVQRLLLRLQLPREREAVLLLLFVGPGTRRPGQRRSRSLTPGGGGGGGGAVAPPLPPPPSGEVYN